MICPDNSEIRFGDVECKICQYYWECLEQSRQEDSLGDNFPLMKVNTDDFRSIEEKFNMSKFPKITKEDVDKFKIELSYIIFFSELEEKLK